MKYPKYPVYKDSGVEWIGEIPENWNVIRLKFLCQLSADYGANMKSEYYSENGVRFLRITDINENGTIIPNGVFVFESLVEGKILE
ncbi:type I restriction-modification system, S subunit, partial [mine drainage metagenome]